MNPLVIAIDGIISSGKTEFIALIKEVLASEYDIYVVKEPVDCWGDILKRFYEDPSRWGYHFQTKVFCDKVKENIRVYDSYLQSQNKRKTLFLLERSPFTDRLFMQMLYDSKKVDDLEYQHYQEWSELWHRIMPYRVDVFLYLVADIPVTMQRIKSRARDGEDLITTDYQEKLHQKHEQYFGTSNVYVPEYSADIPLIRLENNNDYRGSTMEKKKFVSIFLGRLSALGLI